MNSANVIQNYMALNAALLAGFMLFRGFKTLLAAFSLSVKPRHLQIWAQGLLVTALMVPLALELVPRENLPRIELRSISPNAESRRAFLPRHANGGRKDLNAVAFTEENSRGGLILRACRRQLLRLRALFSAATWLGLLASGGLFFFIKMMAQFWRLKGFLASVVPHRRVSKIIIGADSRVVVPFSVWFWGRYWVVVPAGMLERPSDLKIALLHELQHHRQRDTIWAQFMEALVCVFYLNPAIYFWRREIVELQELSCDAALIIHKRISCSDYARCLVRVANAAINTQPHFLSATSMAGGPTRRAGRSFMLMKRVKAMINLGHRKSSAWPAVFALAALSGVLTAALAYGAQVYFVRAARERVNPGVAQTDPAIQKIVEDILLRALRDEKAKSGFAVVSDPTSGRILAVANFDRQGSHPTSKHWALAQRLEPASLAKTLLTARAVDAGVLSLADTVDGENGNYKIGGHVYHDWKPFGKMTVADAVVTSSNIGGIKVGEQLGAEKVAQTLSQFGIGPDGVAAVFPEARTGVLPPFSQVANGQFVPVVATGYGYVITPLELLQAYGAIANGGRLMAPVNANDPGEMVIRRILSSETAAKMRAVLEQVLLRGTAAHRGSNLYTSAGKTATSYHPGLSENKLLGGAESFGSFIGFAPAQNPRVEIFVAIHDPQTSKDHKPHGSEHAAPVFTQIVDRVLRHLGVTPDKI